MRLEQIIQGSFGGAYLGIIATHVPSILGFAWRPTQNVELLACFVGLAIAAGICFREHVRSQVKTSRDKCCTGSNSKSCARHRSA